MPNIKTNIFLVGPMGAGKSTTGRVLARRLGLDFVDSDTEIEARTGADIPLIFEIEGEAGFRQREEAMIDELSQREGIVLATGGGAILSPANRRRLGARGFVVYLETSVEQQLERTQHDRNRPLLQTDDREARLRRLLEERAPLYRETADLVVPTSGETPRRVVGRIIRALEDKAAL